MPEPVRGDWSSDRGYAVGKELAAAVRAGDGPTAVFAGNDQLALGLLRAFWEQGVRVPTDVSVVGFDDVAGAGHFIPPLTTVRQPFGSLGRRCMGMMIDALSGATVRPVSIPPELMVRESTTTPRG